MNTEILIRPEIPDDIAAIWEVTQRAFAGRAYSGGNEQDIIDALRAQGALTVSLVAEQEGIILGHVAFSPARAEDGAVGWYTLGPIAVAPERQRQGIGKALIRAGLQRLRELDAAGCILIGDTNYYAQLGFEKAPQCAPTSAPKDHYMVLCLGAPLPTCPIDFHPAFYR